MGSHRDKTPGDQEVYHLKKREIRIINEIWKSVEADLLHYRNQFFRLLFENHPKFIKYFKEDMSEELRGDVSVMKKKFSLVCSTLAALFVDYSHKSRPRDHLLGYVAMAHKDMNLTQKDMENFMLNMMEMLMEQFPKELTADLVLAYMRYIGPLITRIQMLMEEQREFCRLSAEMTQMDKKDPKVGCFPSKKCLPRHENLIYGRSAQYWTMKRRHWTLQRAVWATVSETGTVEGPRISRIREYPRQSDCPTLLLYEEKEIAAKSSDFDNGVARLTRPERSSLKTGTVRREFSDDRSYDSSRSKQPNGSRPRLLSIVYSAARERRRRRIREEHASAEYPRLATRRLTIEEKAGRESGTSRHHQSHNSSLVKFEKTILPSGSRSLNVPSERMRDRGTSISNVPNGPIVIKRTVTHEKRCPTDRPSSIISSSGASGRHINTNKQVSISKAH